MGEQGEEEHLAEEVGKEQQKTIAADVPSNVVAELELELGPDKPLVLQLILMAVRTVAPFLDHRSFPTAAFDSWNCPSTRVLHVQNYIPFHSDMCLPRTMNRALSYSRC